MKRETYLKSLLAFLLLMVGAAPTWAEDVTYSPTQEVNFRTAADNTTWNSGYPKDAAADGNTGMEGNYFAGMFVLQKYKVANLAYATSIKLTLTDVSTSGVDGTMVWIYPSNDWTASTTIGDMLETVTSVVGLAPRATEGTAKSPLATATKVTGSNPAQGCFTIEGDALETLKAAAAADGTFTLMITDKSLTSNSSRKFRSSNSATEEAYRPTLVATIEAPATPAVLNKTTGVSYTTLTEAFNAAVTTGTDAELEVNEDQTLSGRLTWGKAHTLTITPKKDITIKGHKNGMWFLANTNGGVLNIGSSDYTITLDGENSAFEYDVTKYENSATIALTNVVFQNFDLNNVGHLVGSKANEGQIILDKVTFKNCKNPANAFIDKQRVTNDRLVLKGYLNIDSDCTGTAVYAASETKDSGTTGRIKVDDGGFTASNPITIEWPGTKSEGIVVVIGTSESNASLFKLTDSDWDLTRKSNGDLVLAEAATPTYTITDNSGEGGSLSFSPASPVTSGTEVTITVTPESGKQLKEGTLSAKDATEAVVTITDNKFTMPASNVTVTAEFEDVVTPPSNYTVTQSTATNGSYALTVGGEAAATEIAEGATVTITITPDTGYEVDEVTVVKTDDPSTTVEVSGTASPYTFTMPAYGVTVTVTFKAQTATGNVVNKTTGVSYATLAEAFTAAVEAGTDAELEVNEDQTLSGRLTWNKATTLTITPKKNITIKGHKNGMWFLANTSGGVLNIGSSDYTITLDGENSAFEYDVTKYENSATIALTNVVFQNFDLNNVGHLVGSKANEGQIILDKVTFKNCKNPANAFIDKQRVTNDRLVLKGYLNIDSDCTGTAVYAASETKDSGTTGRIKVDDAGFTASNPITIEWPGTKADNIVVVIGTSESNAGLFKLTGTGWDLSRKSNGDLVMAAATVTTYTVSIADGITNGSIGVDKTSAAEGETVTVNTITPDTGYQLESLTYTSEGGTATDITETKSFTMPAANVTVNAVFSVSTPSTPTVTFNSEVKDASDNVIGTFAVKNGETSLSDLAEVAANTVLTIVTSPAAGYEVDAISIKKTDNTEVEYTKTADNTYTFNMPDVSVGISVTFKVQTTIDYTKTFKVDGVGSWPTLTEALSALTTSGETILVQNDAVTTMDSRIKFGGSDGYQATVTIKAADGVTYTIERGTQNGVLFNWGGNGTVTFENVVFDEKESTQGPLFETDGGSRSYVFNNVTFKNSKSSNAGGLFNLKNGQMTFNNVTLDACTVSNAFIRTAVATGGITFTGTFTVNANCSGDFLRLASGVTLDATALPTMDSYKIEIEDNTPVITNVADETAAGKFTLATLGYVKSYDLENKKITFSEDNTGAFKIEGATGTYPTLQDAINAASDGQTIQVNTGSVTLDAAVTLDKAVSIVPTQALTIKRGTSLAKDAVLFSLATSKNVTIGSNDYALTIDGQGSSLEESPTEKLIQVTAGTLTLVNTTITNAKTTANQGVICAKNNGKITLNGVTFTDCTVPSGKGVVFVGKDEGLTLSGNNVFNGNGIYVEKALKIVDSGTTHTSAISIIVEDANRTAAGVVVSGTSDVSKYTLVSNSWELAADTENNNLVIAEKSYDYSKTFKVEGVGSFDTLAEALAGLTTSNQTILVQSDAVTKMDSRIKFGGSDGYQATVTIKAADGVTYTIERGTQNGVLFNWGGNGTVTFENVVFDEKESTQGPLFETDGGSRSYVFNNVTFKNSKSSNAVGLFNLKNGQMTFNNVTLDACTVSNAFIRTAVATGGITFTGTFTVNANCSGDFLRLASGVTLDATALPTMDSYTIEIEDGTPVITNVTDESKFTLMTDTYVKSFDAETKVISFTEKTFDYTKTFKVESVGSFDTLKEALDSESVTDGATIIVQATEMTLEAQTAFNKSVAIVPDGDALTIKRATTLTGETDAVLFSLATAEKTVTIGGEGKTVTIDGQGTASSKALAEVTNGTLKFVNTTIKDVVTSNNQGVLCAKNSGTISLNNVTFSGCQATADKAGVVFCGRNDAIKLEGAISFTGGSGYNFFLEKRLRVMNTLTATGLTLFAKEAEGGVVTTLANSLAVVYENGSYYSADHFALQNAGYTMELQTNGKDVALVAKSFGITIASGIANGSVSVDATDATTVAVGTEVTITATPDAGFKLKAGSLVATYGSENTVVTITDNKFKMPAGDVTISAVFESTVVVTTPQTITVKDRMNVNGATRKYADNSKSVASTNANNSIWYLGDVDMTKVHSITIKGAAFVNGTINDVDTKAQLKLGYLAAGTISSVSADELSANSGTIRAASNLMAQLTAQTIPTTVADGSDATNYAGADFEITADGVTQTGTYDGSVTIDTENTKGLQKTDAVYQLFLYGTAQSRRLAVDEVIINFEGNSVPEGAYADNTYEEPMTNVGQDTEVIGEPAAGYTKATLAASADTYLRKGNADNNGAKPQMEVYTYTNAESDPAVDKDFVGLLSFDLPIRAKSAGAEIQKVQLRLVGKRLKGGRNMNIYGFGSDFEESAKYADLESAVTAAREAGAIHSYETRGQAGLDVETNYESLTSYNATIAGWTNYFDLTSYVQGLSDTKVRLMIASPDNSDNQKIYYTKEAADISNDVMTVAAADLVPQLIIVYKEGENLLSVSHPAMLHTAVDIARVKSNLGISPVREAFEHLQGSNYAQSSYTAQPVEYLKRMDAANWGPDGTYGQNADYNNYTYAMRDANAAYQLALRYQLEGSTDCADAAVKILNDWTTTNKGLYKITDAGWANDIPDPNEYLILIQGHQFANAAELLRDYSGWSSTDFTAFKSWMKSTFSDNAMVFLQNHHGHTADKHYWLNWDLAALTSVLSVGILCDDKNLTDYAINYYKGTAVTTTGHTSAEEVGYYQNAIPYIYNEDGTIGLGQCQESGRDQGHSLLDVALLGAFCQMAKNMGIEGEDLFATDDYRAVKMAEYVGKYNLGNDVDFTTYNPNTEYNHTAISADGRGGVRPVWELFWRYARENGKTAKYAQQWAENLRTENAWGEGGAGDYGTNSNGFDQLGYGTLMYGDPTSADGQDAKINEDDYAGKTISKRGAQGDTYVRSTAAGTKYGTANQMEVYTTASADFASLLSFKLPADAIGKVEKAQLRLVTKRRKNSSNINIFQFEDFDETAATYTSTSAALSTARATAPLATFTPKGQSTMDVTSDGTKPAFAEDYRTLEAWTNRIDLTGYVKGLTGRNVNLLLTDASMTDTDGIQFFTKEWSTALTSDGTTASANAISADVADLVPQLILVFASDGVTKTYMVDGSGFTTLADAMEEVADGGTILVTADATIDSQVSFSKNVTIKSDGETVRTLKRGVNDKVPYLMGANKTVTFENIILDENGATDKSLLEVNNSQTFVLKNVTIQNAKYAGADGLLDVKNGTLTLSNVTFKDCALANAYIRTAKANGGGLDLANVIFTNSTGNHIRLRASASIDGAAVLSAIAAPVTIDINGADYEKLSITNVTDLSKFQLVTDGYEMKLTDGTVSFVKEADGQDTDDLTKYDGTTSTRTPEADTFVRSTSADTKYGTANNIEVHTNASADFAGLLSFRLPGNAVADGAEIQKVQLRLVTKRKKSTGGINIFKFGDFAEGDATYTTTSEAITAARKTDAIAKFYPNGQYNMDVTADGTKESFSDDYKKLSAWENRIDLTSYVKGLGSQTVNLLLSASANDGQTLQFFSKEWTTDLSTAAASDGTASTHAFTASASDLVPQLIVIYKGTTTTNTFVIEDEGSYATLEEALAEVADGGTIIVTANTTVGARTTFEKSVTIKGQTGKEVIKRDSTEAAMKQSVLFKANSGKKVYFENLVIDDNASTVGLIFEVDNNTFTLKDMTIRNSKSAHNEGIIGMKKGTLTLDNLTIEDCAINNAFVRLGGGTFAIKNKLTLTNSTGDHFRLGNVELDAAALPAIDGAWTIEVENTSAKIINVDDAAKFELTTIGYVKNFDAGSKTITFEEENDGQDTEIIVVPEGAQKETITTLVDTYVRKNNTGNNGNKPSMEIYTYEDSENDLDFVGLMTFKLPADLTKEGAKLHKAQLRLVSKRVKGSRIMDIHAFYRDFDESATYNQVNSIIDELRNGGRLHRFHAMGQAGMDIEADVAKLSDDYKNIEAWTNRIDLTGLVSEAMHDDGKVRLALMSPLNSKDAKMFYTKEATGISNSEMNVDADELVPQLILVYDPGMGESTLTAKNIEATPNADTFVRKGSSSDNSISTAIEVYTYQNENQDIDFVGLLSFNLDAEVQAARTRAQKDTLEVFSATLRLVSKRVRGEKNMNLYAFDKTFSNKSTYSELETSIQETRESGKKVSFVMAGQDGKDITTDSGLTGNYKTSITAWTNEIDLSSLIKDSNANTLRLMISAADNGKNSKQFFSSEAESFTNDNNKDFIVAEENLWPLLTISFRNPMYTDIEETIVIPVSEERIYDLRGNRVQSMGKGVYIVNGKKVLKK